MKINYLSDRWSWFGNHSGYDQIIKYIQNNNLDINIINTKRGFLQQCIGKIYSIYKKWPQRDQNYTASELRFFYHIKKRLKNKNELFHVLYYDAHYFFWEHWNKAPKNLIGTIHHPPPRKMDQRMKDNLKRMSSAIVLSSCNLNFYKKYIENIKFIPHGIDIDFFKPKQKEFSEEKHLLFVGQNGRNTKMFYRIIIKLSKKYPKLKFDLLVKKQQRNVNGLKQLDNNPSVIWHENLSDKELLKLYQNSHLLLMPMESCSANNAIVESLACGLPIITTDVGGIRDYGGDSIYPVISNNDNSAMIGLIEKYLSDEKYRNEIAKKQREFAEQKLAWPIIAKEHSKVYKELTE